MLASSFVHGEDSANLGNVFTVFETIGKNAKRESFRFGDGFIACATVGENTRKIGDLADPATVLFSLDLYGEVAHASDRTTTGPEREIRQPNVSHAQLRGRFRVPKS